MKLRVNLENNSYDIVVEKNSIEKVDKFFNLNRKVLIVTDDKVPKSYSEIVAKKCLKPFIFTFKSGERSKNFETYKKALEILIKENFTRTDCVVAVGGGVVGDLAGFVSATYMRGIDFYNLPTTVLASVDSSVGGKTAIDFENVKNIIGAFYQPKGVLVDVGLLKTLDKRQVSNGLVEALKMATTFSEELFNVFENEDIYDNLEKIITESIKLKIKVVEEDEKESSLRRVLNFGHTLGHGIESASNLKLLHGECIAVGMIPMCSENVRLRLKKVLAKLNVATTFDGDIEKAIEISKHDKKCDGENINIVYVEKVGSFRIEKTTFNNYALLIKKVDEWRK